MKKAEPQNITIVDGEDILPKTNIERVAQRALERVRKARKKIERYTNGHQRVQAED